MGPVYDNLTEMEDAPPEGRVVTIGFFDGVHIGHQRIVARTVEAARACSARATGVTFYPHPDVVLRPRSAPRTLTTAERKAELLVSLGMDEVVIVGFDRRFARLSAESFCRTVLSERLNTKMVFVGENFHFGRGGSGGPAELVEYGRSHGFRVWAVPLVKDAEGPVSSTRIRALLSSGHVEEAAGLLGRPHRLEGLVTKGAGRGRTLNAPTANVAVAEEMTLPGSGVYVTRTAVGGEESYPSVTSVGTNPTFETGKVVRVETMVLDRVIDLYGVEVAVDFLDKIRGQKAFADASALSQQITLDVALAREAHAKKWSQA
jgi:riboflavin kinase/FMN adenylyltransferase